MKKSILLDSPISRRIDIAYTYYTIFLKQIYIKSLQNSINQRTKKELIKLAKLKMKRKIILLDKIANSNKDCMFLTNSGKKPPMVDRCRYHTKCENKIQ